MIKRILVATDASEYSRHALSKAVEYAKQFNAEIELMHVVSQPTMAYPDLAGNFMLYSDEQIVQIANDVINATLEGIDVGQIPIIKKTASGYPAAAILEEIDCQKDIDMVVMGSKGHGPLASVFVGSVTQRVLAESRVPVIVVK
jgi:nucleotide-binding universal stress UspA family protein